MSKFCQGNRLFGTPKPLPLFPLLTNEGMVSLARGISTMSCIEPDMVEIPRVFFERFTRTFAFVT